MAFTVPVIDAPRVSNTATPLPLERADQTAGESPWSVVSSAAGNVEKVASQYQAIQLDEKRKADLTAVQEALNQQREFNDAALERVRQAEGKNAAVEAEKAYNDTDHAAKTIWGGLANDDQKRLFSEHANTELLQVKRLGEAHVGQQIAVQRDRTFAAANHSSLRRAARYGADAPEVVGQEAGAIQMRVQEYGKAKGLDDAEMVALRDAELAKLYVAHTKVLIGLGRWDQAKAVLDVHGGVMGEEASGLQHSVTEMTLKAKGDRVAMTIAGRKDVQNADGTIDLAKAQKVVDQMFQPGPEKDAAWKAVHERVVLSTQARQQAEGQYWDAGFGAYQAQSTDPGSRSVDQLRRDKPLVWASLTPDQRHRLEAMEKADKAAKDGAPLTDAQLNALLRLEADIAERPEWWGTSQASDLTGHADFVVLPERQRLGLVAQVARTHQDRNNPEGALRSAEMTMRARAEGTPMLSKATHGKPFAQWPEKDQANWAVLRDLVGPQIIAWKGDPANKGKRIPDAVIEGFVDEATRQGTLDNTGVWGWFRTKTSAVGAAARPDAERAAKPFVPTPREDEAARGREVLRRQGLDEKVTPDAFKPDKVIAAAKAWRSAQSGPSPQKREELSAELRAQGKPVTEANIQFLHEYRTLKYVR